MSRGTKELIHVQLSSPEKSSMASEGVAYGTGSFVIPFVVKATADVVVVAMEFSAQVLWLFCFFVLSMMLFFQLVVVAALLILTLHKCSSIPDARAADTSV